MRAIAQAVRSAPSKLGLLGNATLPAGRCFSTSAGRQATWGFIGLGQMGEFDCLMTGARDEDPAD